MSQSTVEKLSPLGCYVRLPEWHERNGGSIFPTLSSLEWFIRLHRDELVKCGALLPRDGRSGSLIDDPKFAKAVVRIFRRRAVEKIERSGTGE